MALERLCAQMLALPYLQSLQVPLLSLLLDSVCELGYWNDKLDGATENTKSIVVQIKEFDRGGKNRLVYLSFGI
jgi:hypothetical protein